MLLFADIGKKHWPLIEKMELRGDDVRELLAASGCRMIKYAIRKCLRKSNEWTKACIDSETGRVIAVWGLSSSGAVGHPWMFGTAELLSHKKFLMRASAVFIQHMLDEFSVLSNYVDSRNTTHIAWLKRLGFTVTHIDAVTKKGVRFHYFYKER